MKRVLKLAAFAIAMGALAIVVGTVYVGRQVATQRICRARLHVLQEVVAQASKAADYELMLSSTKKLIACAPDDPLAFYNHACALARTGDSHEALAAVRRAVELGYEDAAWLRKDEDLASIRADPRFSEAAALAERNVREGFGPIAKAPRLEGVRTVEAFPDKGLRVRLHLPPDASPESPAPVIVWLHPSGSLGTALVEPLAPRFAKLGYALLVPTQKMTPYWTDEHAARLLDVTLPAVAKYGVRIEKPILFGFSAGGQEALVRWDGAPARFGGIILDAAYPMNDKPGEPLLKELPKDPAALAVPFFVAVGTADVNCDVWRSVEPKWKAAGIDLEMAYVEGGVHQWLFGDEEVARLERWLSKRQPAATAQRP